MASPRRRVPVALTALLAAASCGLLPAAADASRRPTTAEASAIKRIALRACEAPGGCRFHGARVSTRDARFAWADVTGEGFSGVLLKRKTTQTRRFRVAGIQGGGIELCSVWRKRAPRAVLRDLRVSGLLDEQTGRSGRCG